MKRANWNEFNIKNKDTTTAFEELSRNLFLRELGVSRYEYVPNQAGLEIEPIYNSNDKKYYGFQSKYFISASSTKKYEQLYDSLSKAFKYYKGRLDVVYIYTNSELEIKCTPKELKEGNSKRIKIIREADKNGIELRWILSEVFLDKVREKENLDLYNLYFSDSQESKFLNDFLSVEENTFLQSNEFIDLKFTNEKSINDMCLEVSKNNLNLILGAAGTGKSIAMKKIYKYFVDEFNKKYFQKEEDQNINEKVLIPIFLKLRECINGNIEQYLREKLRDYKINLFNSSYEYVYLIDGLDELPNYNINRLVYFINNELLKGNIKSIIVSSRSDSNNLVYFKKEFENKYKSYEFKNLEYKDIYTFFEHKGNLKKIGYLEKLEKSIIINDINDIFSADLLWNNVMNITAETSKIEIIELAVQHIISSYSKLGMLPMLEPKLNYIFRIYEEIAYSMQENLVYYTYLTNVQDLIKEICVISSPNDINHIVNSLTDMFIECNYVDSDAIITFKHKRFQEYFLYRKVEKMYYKDPSILRKLNLFANKDFITNIFLRTSLKRAEDQRDIFKCLALRELECYLGSCYVRDYKDKIIGRDKLLNSTKASYSFSNEFLYLLSTYDVDSLKMILENPNYNLKDAINKDNFAKLIEVYYRRNNKDISNYLMEYFNLNNTSINSRNSENFMFYKYKIQGCELKELYKMVKIHEQDVKDMSYICTTNKIAASFFKIALEYDIKYVTSLVDKIDIQQLEVLSFVLIKHKNINILFDSNKDNIAFREILKNRISSIKSECYINTLALYNLISNKTEEVEKLKEAFNKVNVRNFPTWATNIELNILLAYLQKEKRICKLSEFNMGIDLVKVVYENYTDKDFILDEWLKIIKPYNFIYNDWLKYSNSKILGVLIAKLNFSIINLRKFIRELIKYPSIIYMPIVFFSIYEYNNELFKKIVNKSILDKILENEFYNNEDSYDILSDSLFKTASMYDGIDNFKKYELMIMGINNSYVRPNYSEDLLLSLVLSKAIYIAYKNYWYDDNEVKSRCIQLFDILETANRNTENAGNTGYLKWVVFNCCKDNYELKKKLYDSDVRSLEYEYKSNATFNKDNVTIENISDYYECKVSGMPYSEIELWKELIGIEYKESKNLDILFNSLRKNYYPGYFGYRGINYYHIPTYILLDNVETKEKMVDFIINQGGEFGLYNMIKTYSLLSDREKGIECINFLFNFAELMVCSNYIEEYKEKEVNRYNIFDNYSIFDYECWEFDESNYKAYLKSNNEIMITWNEFNDRIEFKDEWATNFPDPKAYRYEYKLYINGELIKDIYLVKIDGFRATLPIPMSNTKVVKREDYLISKIFNVSSEKFNTYMIEADLIVE